MKKILYGKQCWHCNKKWIPKNENPKNYDEIIFIENFCPEICELEKMFFGTKI